MVPRYNDHLRQCATNFIERRREEVRKKNSATDRLKRLPIRIRRRTDGSDNQIVPVKRRPAPVPKKPSSSPATEGEYVLTLPDYESILKTIRSMVLIMERSPDVFAMMGEESLRTVLLVNLNGLYEGQATGETFNGYGKSDILIRVENKNIFIAECLVWDGEKALLAKMNDQLFQYAMWRDTKVALIVFSRRDNFSNVVATMKKTVATHPQCLGLVDESETEGTYRFHRHDDADRHFYLTCMAFTVPKRKSDAG